MQPSFTQHLRWESRRKQSRQSPALLDFSFQGRESQKHYRIHKKNKCPGVKPSGRSLRRVGVLTFQIQWPGRPPREGDAGVKTQRRGDRRHVVI